MITDERIMVYGGTGSGKSYSWLSLAKALPECKFYCIDTDKAISRMLLTEFRELKNVSVFSARTWLECEAQLAKIESLNPTEIDWIVVDMLDTTWDFVQANFIEQIHGKKIDDYYMEARKSLKSGTRMEVLKGWVDWNVINKTYQDWCNHLMYDTAPNKYVTAKATNMTSSEEQPILDIFGSLGVKPEGEKRNSYRVHSVLLLNQTSSGYYVTTAKDRGRPKVEKFPIKNFAEFYLPIIEGKEIELPELTKEQFLQWCTTSTGKLMSQIFVMLEVEDLSRIPEKYTWKQAQEAVMKSLKGGG